MRVLAAAFVLVLSGPVLAQESGAWSGGDAPSSTAPSAPADAYSSVDAMEGQPAGTMASKMDAYMAAVTAMAAEASGRSGVPDAPDTSGSKP